jgi:ribosomal protein S18 acetylase RimI-like enzyme
MYNDNELCGWLAYRLVKDKDVLYIKSLFIHPDFQNKGLGKQFIKMVIENMKNEELPSNIEALVDVENKSGIRFFESMNVKEKQMIGSDFIKYTFDSRTMWSEKNKQI